MDLDAKLHLEIALVLAAVLLIVVVTVVAYGGACEGDGDVEAGTTGRAAVHAADALGDATLMTYEQAASGKVKEGECCAFCLSEYVDDGELVRVVPPCGHYFHAECGVDKWLRKRRTCPLCRGGLGPPSLPGMPRLECPPMPPRRPQAFSVV